MSHPDARAVTCNICHRKFFPASLKFHIPKCRERQQYVEFPCESCGLMVQRRDMDRHLRQCRRGVGGPRSSSAPPTPGGDGGGGIAIHNRKPDDSGRVECASCGRKFTLDRVGIHERICKKTTANQKSRMATNTSHGAARSLPKPPSASGQGNSRVASRPTTSSRPARPASGGSGRPDTASSKAAWKQQHLELQQLIKGGRTKSPASKRLSSSSSLSSTPDDRRRVAAAEAAAALRSSSAEIIKRPGGGSTQPSSGGINRMTNATYTKQQESRSPLGRGVPSPSPPTTAGGSRQQQRHRSPVDARGTPSPGGQKSVSWAPTDSEDGSGSPSPDALRWDQQRGKQTRGSPRDRYEGGVERSTVDGVSGDDFRGNVDSALQELERDLSDPELTASGRSASSMAYGDDTATGESDFSGRDDEDEEDEDEELEGRIGPMEDALEMTLRRQEILEAENEELKLRVSRLESTVEDLLKLVPSLVSGNRHGSPNQVTPPSGRRPSSGRLSRRSSQQRESTTNPGPPMQRCDTT